MTTRHLPPRAPRWTQQDAAQPQGLTPRPGAHVPRSERLLPRRAAGAACADPWLGFSQLTFTVRRLPPAGMASRGCTALVNCSLALCVDELPSLSHAFQDTGFVSRFPPLCRRHCTANPCLPSPRPGEGCGRRVCYLAGVHLALREASAEHPVCEGEVVEGAACLLVYDAHGRPLEGVRLRRCGERGPSVATTREEGATNPPCRRDAEAPGGAGNLGPIVRRPGAQHPSSEP